jgi:hypothetical protein
MSPLSTLLVARELPGIATRSALAFSQRLLKCFRDSVAPLELVLHLHNGSWNQKGGRSQHSSA